MDLKKQLFVWTMKVHLNQIETFYSSINNHLCQQSTEIDEELKKINDREEKADINIIKAAYVDFGKRLRINTFLMMYSYLEEYLFHMKTFNKETKIGEIDGIQRFKSVIEEILKIDVTNNSIWFFLCDASKIRNCLLHANGRLDLLKKEENKKHLKNLTLRSNDMLSLNGNHIQINETYLVEVKKVIYEFISRLDSSVE